MYYFNEGWVSTLVAMFSILLSALLLIGPILSLYFVTSPRARLGMIAGYTILFAASIGALTSARRSEIFGATAAYVQFLHSLQIYTLNHNHLRTKLTKGCCYRRYAAVLVVFVSGNLGGL
jgi:hypothetical protein